MISVTRPSALCMSDPMMGHCNGPVSWDHYVHVHHIHEWERLRGLGGEEKDGTEEDHFFAVA